MRGNASLPSPRARALASQDSCGDMLTNANMGGMHEMGLFYDRCLERLYPPGTCGAFCNAHTFDCYIAEVQEACCDEGGRNCVSNEDVPEQCPVGCAIVFPQFLETCSDHLEQSGATIEDYRAFAQECMDMDGIELVEYVITLRESGCVVDLGEEREGSGDGGGGGGSRRALARTNNTTTRRQAQSFFVAPGGNGASNGSSSQCPWDVVDDLASEVDSICCAIDEALCSAGAEPQACSAACAVAVHQFTPCVETLEAFGALTDAFEQSFAHFEAQCMAAVEGTEEILHAIMGAVCPDAGESQGAAPVEPPPPPPPPSEMEVLMQVKVRPACMLSATWRHHCGSTPLHLMVVQPHCRKHWAVGGAAGRVCTRLYKPALADS
eukprot:SAG31_NODE_90_length_26410_cov_175.663981_16_plen_380_part_00